MGKSMWMIRAGRGGALVDRFRDQGHVGLGQGGEALGALPYAQLSRSDLQGRLAARFPAWKKAKVANAAGQLHRFFTEVAVGDAVITADSERREYLLGTIDGALDYRDGDELPYIRKVKWRGKVPRDVLSPTARNPLGAIMTLFRVPDEVAAELEAKRLPLDAATDGGQVGDGPSADEVLAAADDPSERALELIEDRINALDWSELQDLVAGLLRAMGYKAHVSPKGADRGVDVTASPDGLGLQEPRIFAEVKHQSQPIGAQGLRSFLGGRKAGDRCLYVSTGGFTKEARYEAERSNIPISLIDLPLLRQLVTDHYERAGEELRRLVPLVRIYWPISDED